MLVMMMMMLMAPMRHRPRARVLAVAGIHASRNGPVVAALLVLVLVLF